MERFGRKCKTGQIGIGLGTARKTMRRIVYNERSREGLTQTTPPEIAQLGFLPRRGRAEGKNNCRQTEGLNTRRPATNL
jgi:hypothetical protein